MNDLQQDLLDLIEKNLPSATVGVIKDRLEKADEMERNIYQLKATISRNEKYTSTLYSEKAAAEEKVLLLEEKIRFDAADKTDILNLKRACQDERNNWAVTVKEIELKCEKKINDNMFNLMSQVFHSPVFKSEQHGFIPVKTENGTSMQPFNMVTKTECSTPTDHRHYNENGLVTGSQVV